MFNVIIIICSSFFKSIVQFYPHSCRLFMVGYIVKKLYFPKIKFVQCYLCSLQGLWNLFLILRNKTHGIKMNDLLKLEWYFSTTCSTSYVCYRILSIFFSFFWEGNPAVKHSFLYVLDILDVLNIVFWEL